MSERVFREIIGDGIEGNFWKPTQIGQKLEGKIVEFKEGQYGLQAVVMMGDGYEIELPAHRDLQAKLKQVYERDYIRVTLIDFKKSNNPDYNDRPLYKVEVAEED